MARNEGNRDDGGLVGLLLVLAGLVIILGHGWFNSEALSRKAAKDYERLERDFQYYREGVTAD